jgi:hypothetical protein
MISCLTKEFATFSSAIMIPLRTVGGDIMKARTLKHN